MSAMLHELVDRTVQYLDGKTSMRDLDLYASAHIQIYVDSGDADLKALADDILAGTVVAKAGDITLDELHEMLRERLSEPVVGSL